MLNLETIDCNGVNHNQLIELTSEELKPFIEKLKSAQRVIFHFFNFIILIDFHLTHIQYYYYRLLILSVVIHKLLSRLKLMYNLIINNIIYSITILLLLITSNEQMLFNIVIN